MPSESHPPHNGPAAFWRSVGGASGLKEAPAHALWTAAAVGFLVASGLLLVAAGVFFPYYENSATFLPTVPVLPLIWWAGLFLAGWAGGGDRAPAKAACCAGAATAGTGLTVALAITALDLFWGSIGGVAALLAVTTGGIAWTAVTLYLCWTRVLGVRAGLAALLSGFLVAAVLFAGLYLWVRVFTADLLFWDPILFLERGNG